MQGDQKCHTKREKKIENEWNKNVWQWELTNMAQIPLTSIKSKWTMKLLREAVYENEGIDTSCRSQYIKLNIHFILSEWFCQKN